MFMRVKPLHRNFARIQSNRGRFTYHSTPRRQSVAGLTIGSPKEKTWTQEQRLGALAYILQNHTPNEAHRLINQPGFAIEIPQSVLKEKGLAQRLTTDTHKIKNHGEFPEIFSIAHSVLQMIRLLPFTGPFWHHRPVDNVEIEHIPQIIREYSDRFATIIQLSPGKGRGMVSLCLKPDRYAEFECLDLNRIKYHLYTLIDHHPVSKRTLSQKIFYGLLTTGMAAGFFGGVISAGIWIPDWVATWPRLFSALAIFTGTALAGLAGVYPIAMTFLAMLRLSKDRLVPPFFYKKYPTKIHENKSTSLGKKMLGAWKGFHEELTSLMGERRTVFLTTSLLNTSALGLLGFGLLRGYDWILQMGFSQTIAGSVLGLASALTLIPIGVYSMYHLTTGLLLLSLGGNRVLPAEGPAILHLLVAAAEGWGVERKPEGRVITVEPEGADSASVDQSNLLI